MKINHTSWKSVTLAVTTSLLMSGAAAATTPDPRINTLDVLATQKQFLAPFLTGCNLVAADVTVDNVVNTADVLAIERYFLGFPTGIAMTGMPGGCNILGNVTGP